MTTVLMVGLTLYLGSGLLALAFLLTEWLRAGREPGYWVEEETTWTAFSLETHGTEVHPN